MALLLRLVLTLAHLAAAAECCSATVRVAAVNVGESQAAATGAW